MKRLFLLPLAAMAACSAGPPNPPVAAPRFDAKAFFTGTLHGDGTLKVLTKSPRHVTVESRGHVDPDGTLVLDQHVVGDGDAPRDRVWHIRETAPGRYAGTLSDAAGPITGDVTGNRLHLAFPMKGGLKAQQWLDLSPDGRAADNLMKVTKFGVTVATLHEKIAHTD
jgi:hypothetical protein